MQLTRLRLRVDLGLLIWLFQTCFIHTSFLNCHILRLLHYYCCVVGYDHIYIIAAHIALYCFIVIYC